MYAVKEIFYSLQGEGARSGRAAVFLRFSGCNLWNGLEKDRSSAVCKFCDTDFFGTDGSYGGKYENAEALAEQIAELWPKQNAASKPYVVCTGGEPLLQLDAELLHQLHLLGFEVAVETNGTLPVPEQVDWICVSPKANAELKQINGNELKLVYPQEMLDPQQFSALDFEYYFLQPMDGPDLAKNMKAAVDYCLAHPQWRLSLQTHKTVGIR